MGGEQFNMIRMQTQSLWKLKENFWCSFYFDFLSIFVFPDDEQKKERLVIRFLTRTKKYYDGKVSSHYVQCWSILC